MSASLASIVILEQPGGVATRYCGKLFAAHGAAVLQSGAPETTGVGYGGAASEAYAAWLDHGKQRVGSDRLASRDVDLVIAGQTPAQVAAADAALADVPDTLRLGITWFAPDGPYRDWTGSDAVIQAMSGVAYSTGPKNGHPMLPRGHAPQVVCGATAFIAALAAIVGRDQGWAGRRLDIDILSANLCFTEGGASTLALTKDKVTRRGVNRFAPTFPGGIYQASDGWIGVTALTPAQWSSLCDMIGRPELARDARNRVSLQRLDRADEIDPVLIAAFRSMSASYLLAEGQRRRIPMAPVPSLADLPRTPHWQGRSSFAPVGGAMYATGPTMPFRFERRAAAPSPATTVAAAHDLPLRGIRVLDLSMGWAGPLAARHFADLGANVVKVESCTHYDWWRGFDGLNDGDPPPYEIRHSFLMVNRNKRGVTLDLKSAAGKDLLRKLAARSDVMIENYAPGVLDKLGIGPTAMADSVPGLIAISMGAFGASGPWSGFRAYGSTVEQASGLPFANGESADPPTMQHVAYGDPIGGLYGAIACLIALYGRRHGRAGTVIDLGQVECLFQLGADAIVAQSTRADSLPRDGSRHPLSALRMIAGDDARASWWAVSAETAAQWNAAARLVGRADLLAPEGADVATLKHRERDMEQAVRTWAATRPVTEAVKAFQAARVPAGPVYAAQDLLQDPQLVASGFWRRVDRRFIGSHVAPLAPYRLDQASPPVWGAAPTLGEHNEPVLGGDLGLTRDELDALAAQGVIGTRAVAG